MKMERDRFHWHRVIACCAVVLLLFAGHAPAQLSTNDWLTAGAYGNLFARDGGEVPPEKLALAELFAGLWHHATGHQIERGPAIKPGQINVALGLEGLNDDVVLATDMAELGPDGYFLSTYSPSPRYAPLGAMKQLVIAGNNPIATRMGVYGLFRRAFDSEWPAPGVADLRRAAYRFEKIREFVKPGFAFREVGYPALGTPDEGEFRMANGLSEVPLGPWRSRRALDWVPAPLGNFLTPSGRENSAKQDLCPSAEGLAEKIAAAILSTKPTEGLESRHVWPISTAQPDLACTCAVCSALSAAEESPIAPWVQLGNRVAKILSEQDAARPHRVLLEVSGAQMTLPKTLQPNDNLIIVLSTAACDFAAPINDDASGENKRIADAIAAWGRTGATVWVVDHLSSLQADPTPFPNLPVLQENLRFYLQHNVSGVYFQTRAPGTTNDDFSALKYFLAARLLFDPDADMDALVERFLTAYYGVAAGEVGAYLRALKPLPGLTPTSTAQSPLLEARAAAQAKLSALLTTLPEDVAARVRVLLP